MKKMQGNFLTSKKFDKEKLIQLIEANQHVISENDSLELKEILSDFKNNDFSLLTPQEIQFIENSNDDIITKYLIFRHKFKKIPKLHIDSDSPQHLIIEPVSACNLRCVMCYQIDEKFSGRQEYMGMMNFDLFCKIVDDAYDCGIKALTLTGRGEPTMHPKIGDMLEYCKDKFFELKINTNATLLKDDLIHQILKSGCNDIVFSIDSYKKDEYETIRVRGIFEEVLNNIKRFQEIREKHYSESKCSTRISGMIINENQNPEKFKKFWQEYVDYVVMFHAQTRWDTYNNPVEIAGKNPCNYLWGEMNVWFDGKCNPCDTDYKSTLSVGDANESSIKEIWNSEKYQELRKLHKSGERNKCYPCDRCSNW